MSLNDNFREHFASYYESFKKDALADYEEYARITPTAKPELYPKIQDYINFVLRGIDSCISKASLPEYKRFLRFHQDAMIALFEKMVNEVLVDGTLANDKEAILALVNEKGWNWFKFSKMGLTITLKVDDGELQLLADPRYRSATYRPYQFDANEMHLLYTVDKAHVPQIINLKREAPARKILSVTDKEIVVRNLSEINLDLVDDWTLPLFGKLP